MPQTAATASVPGRPFRTLVRYNRPYFRRYAAGAALALCFTVLDLVFPGLVRYIIDGLEHGTLDSAALWWCFAVMVGSSLGAGVVRYFQRWLMIGASRHFEYDLRNALFRHLLALSPGFFSRTRTGDILARATNDLNQVREFVGPGVMGSVDMVRIPFTFGLMVYFSPWLTLMSLIPLPFISLLVYVFLRFLNRQSKVVQEIFGQMSSKAQENLAGSRVVRAYGIGDRESRAFAEVSARYMQANVKLVTIMSMAVPILGVLAGTIVMLIVWQGGQRVIDGRLALADLTAFLLCLLMVAWPLAQLGYVLTLYQRGAAGMGRILAVLAETPEVRDTARTRPDAAVGAGEVRFEGVVFDYGEGPVLHGLDFAVPAGQTVALVGPTGSGKSSAIGLVARAFDPAAGAVRVDGIDLREMPLAALREAIGYVSQDVFIFSDTIRGNLMMGRMHLTEEDLWRACAVAQLDGAIRAMPAGLDTLLGERGINLSGGQKQRLTLARAIAGNPKILLLDDALSSVDTHTEEQILRGLRGVMAERTCAIVSHRVSTIRHADCIVVLDGGRVAESGRHDALIALDGIYAAMYRRQLLEEALEDAGGEAAGP